MDWLKLDLTKVSAVKREVDMVSAKLNEYNTCEATSPETTRERANFLADVQMRIQDLENFYLQNSDDDRAVLFEKERLRLRKIIQPFLTAKDNKSLSASDRSQSVGGATSSQQRLERIASSQSIKDFRTPVQQKPQQQPLGYSLSPTIGGQISSTAIPLRRSPGTQERSLYTWENGSLNTRNVRSTLTIDGRTFEPSPAAGFYFRKFEEMSGVETDQCVDFQIILTQEEMTALAARKKAQKVDAKLFKSQAASSSVHHAIPYVDPKRLSQEMYRPGHPDRWIHP
jgi:hypothetical protein